MVANIHLFCCCRRGTVAPVATRREESGDGLGLIGSVGYIEHYWPVKSQAIANQHTKELEEERHQHHYGWRSFVYGLFHSSLIVCA